MPNQSDELHDSRDPARINRLNDLIELMTAMFPGRVCDVPCDAWMNQHTDDDEMRPDVSHLDYTKALEAGAEFARETVATEQSCHQ